MHTDKGLMCKVPMQDFWGKVQWWWERPPLKRMRTTVSMAQWSVKLPALMALVATQVGLLASQVCACCSSTQLISVTKQ